MFTIHDRSPTGRRNRRPKNGGKNKPKPRNNASTQICRKLPNYVKKDRRGTLNLRSTTSAKKKTPYVSERKIKEESISTHDYKYVELVEFYESSSSKATSFEPEEDFYKYWFISDEDEDSRDDNRYDSSDDSFNNTCSSNKKVVYMGCGEYWETSDDEDEYEDDSLIYMGSGEYWRSSDDEDYN